MLTKISVDNKFSLQGIVISGLLAMICGLLFFILSAFGKQVSETIAMRKEVTQFNQTQYKILSSLQAVTSKVVELEETDGNIFDQIDTIKISLADYRGGVVRLGERVYKLERYHEIE